MPPTTAVSSAAPATSASCTSERCASAAVKRSVGGLEIGGRDQHRKALAPDYDARVLAEIDTDRNRVALAALEGAQAAEIDVHRLLHLAGVANAGLRHHQHAERRARAYLEIGLEEHRLLVHADAAFAVMDRVGRVGVNEGAARH